MAARGAKAVYRAVVIQGQEAIGIDRVPVAVVEVTRHAVERTVVGHIDPVGVGSQVVDIDRRTIPPGDDAPQVVDHRHTVLAGDAMMRTLNHTGPVVMYQHVAGVDALALLEIDGVASVAVRGARVVDDLPEIIDLGQLTALNDVLIWGLSDHPHICIGNTDRSTYGVVVIDHAAASVQHLIIDDNNRSRIGRRNGERNRARRKRQTACRAHKYRQNTTPSTCCR